MARNQHGSNITTTLAAIKRCLVELHPRDWGPRSSPLCQAPTASTPLERAALPSGVLAQPSSEQLETRPCAPQESSVPTRRPDPGLIGQLARSCGPSRSCASNPHAYQLGARQPPLAQHDSHGPGRTFETRARVGHIVTYISTVTPKPTPNR